MGVEHMEQADGLFYCDFGKTRTDHGPAKGSRIAKAQGFPLQDGEGFCEETAFLYDQATQFMLIQYNHHGARISAILDYFQALDSTNQTRYTSLPKYMEDIQRLISQKRIFKKLELSIAPHLLSDSDLSSNLSLQSALDISNSTGADKITVTISAQPSKGGLLKTISNLLSWATEKAQSEQHDVVSTCRLTAQEDQLAKVEVLDLLCQRLVRKVDIRSGADMRFPRAERFQALKNTWRLWKPLLQK